MSLTDLKKQALANELVEVMENFQQRVEQFNDRYEAVITQPLDDHLIIKLQPRVSSMDECDHY